MKKIALLSVVLSVLLFPSICSAAKFVNIGTGSTGGTYYPLGAAISKIWNDNIPGLRANAQSTGGTINNIQLIGMEEAEAGLMDGMYFDAYNGQGNFQGRPQKFLRALAPLYPDAVHILVAEGSGIKTLQDMAGKKVSIGAVGASIPVVSAKLFQAVGMNVLKDVRPEYLGHGETVAAFADKRISAAVAMGSVGISSVVEATTLGTAHLIGLPPEVVEKICAASADFTPFTLPAGTYRGQDEDLLLLSNMNILAVHQDLDEELVYNMTRLIFEHKADLVAVAATMRSLDAANVKAVKIPLHPGAARYYRELGLID